MVKHDLAQQALDLCARKQELLVAALLGMVLEYGEAHVLDALKQATSEAEAWKRAFASKSKHIPMWVQLQSMAEADRG
jgi:hypothetical protein